MHIVNYDKNGPLDKDKLAVTSKPYGYIILKQLTVTHVYNA